MTRLNWLLETLCESPSDTSRVLAEPSRGSRLGACSTPSAVAAGLLAFAAFFAPSLAAAQSASYFDRNNNVGVMDRPRPDYQATGVDVGSFVLFPSVTGTESYNDNIFASTTGRVSDWITTISPSLDLRSNWSRNALELSASDVSNLYARTSSEDTNDYRVNLFGQLDTTYQSNFTGGIGYAHASLPRTSEATFGNTQNPVEYDTFNANVGGLQTLNRLRFQESVTYVLTDYDNTVDAFGIPLLLSQLDNSQVAANIRASFAIDPSIAVFVNGQYNVRRYDTQPPAAPLDRNSSGYDVTVGADFDITRLIRGQVQIGYLSQNYESPLFHPVSGPSVHAQIEYFLSGLTTITLHANRAVIDDVDPVAVSFLQSEGGVQIDHELLRNVILSGRAAYETDDFTGVVRTDSRTTASLRGTYLLNRHLGLTAAYSFIDLESSGPARIGNYQSDVISFSVVFQL